MELFDEAGEEAGTRSPIIEAMYPDTDYRVEQHNIGSLEIDSSSISTLLPWMPINLKVALPFQWRTIRPRIEASGLMRHDCLWRLSDERITNTFSAGVVVRAPMDHVFRVSIRLHIELRWRRFAVIRRGYMWNDADRKKFQLDPAQTKLIGDDHLVEVPTFRWTPKSGLASAAETTDEEGSRWVDSSRYSGWGGLASAFPNTYQEAYGSVTMPEGYGYPTDFSNQQAFQSEQDDIAAALEAFRTAGAQTSPTVDSDGQSVGSAADPLYEAFRSYVGEVVGSRTEPGSPNLSLTELAELEQLRREKRELEAENESLRRRVDPGQIE
jgi:hypothetical protein